MKKLISVLLSLAILCSVCALPLNVSAEEEEIIIADAHEFPKVMPKPEMKVYYSRAIDPKEAATHQILQAWNDLSTKRIDVSACKLTPKEFTDWYYSLKDIDPRYYYIGTPASAYWDGTHITSFLPTYTESSKAVVTQTLQQVEDAADEILMSIDDEMSDFEKIVTVHNHIVTEYEYNYAATVYGYPTNLGDFDIRTMIKKSGVCQGYSISFKYMMDKLGIECIYSRSDAMQHMWNLVKLGGLWYHVDVTWDDMGNGTLTGITNEYFLLSDESIQNAGKHPGKHHDYDSAGVVAGSKDYDDADWRHSYSEIVSINHITYMVKDNAIVTNTGKVIFEGLDGGDGKWNLTQIAYFTGYILTNLEERNGDLYFNTENKVYKYNPKTGKTEEVWPKDKRTVYLGGFNIDKNTMTLFELNPEYLNDQKNNKPYDVYEIVSLGKARVSKPVKEDKKIKTYIYKEDDEPIIVFCRDKDGTITSQTITKKGMNKVYFDKKNQDQTFFYWTMENGKITMKPLRDKEIVKK